MRTGVWLGLWLFACAPSLPEAYLRSRASAERAYKERHFAEAGQRWLDTANSAATARDRSEARYRAAVSYERAADVARAGALYSQLASGKSERAARATFALADLRVKRGDEAGGYAELEAAVHRFPSSGIASLALRRYFSFLSEQGGDRRVLEYIERVQPTLSHSDVAEQLGYERARRLETLGSTSAARDAYVELAQRFPYPYGAYWDDALSRAADCELTLGRPESAIGLLQRMLQARETAHFSGSYERPRFAEAAYRLAGLYRDARHDQSAARRAFRSVFLDYPNSTLRDDALWHEAMLAHRIGLDESCAPLRLLVQQLPESRYVPCAHELCAAIGKLATRACPAYIEGQLHEAKPEPKPESAD